MNKPCIRIFVQKSYLHKLKVPYIWTIIGNKISKIALDELIIYNNIIIR